MITIKQKMNDKFKIMTINDAYLESLRLSESEDPLVMARNENLLILFKNSPQLLGILSECHKLDMIRSSNYQVEVPVNN